MWWSKFRKSKKSTEESWSRNNNLRDLVIVDEFEDRLYSDISESREGVHLYFEGKLNEALKKFQYLREKLPDFAVAYGWIGIIFSDKGDFDNAFKIFNEGLAKARQKSAIYNPIARVYEKKGQLFESLRYTLMCVYAQKEKPYSEDFLRICSYLNLLLRGSDINVLLSLANKKSPFTQLSNEHKQKLSFMVKSLRKKQRDLLIAWLKIIEREYQSCLEK